MTPLLSARLQPSLTMGELFGTDLLYSPRASPNACTWLPRDSATLDALTGGQLTILGGMPILCAAGVSTPEGLALLRDAGFEVPAAPFRYVGEGDYLCRLSDLSAAGRTIVVQHVLPAGELAPDRCWVQPAILSFLNNKNHLSELVDPAHCPFRRIVETTQLAARTPLHRLPIVVKAVTDESTGGGIDVSICRTDAELESAPAYFAACTRVVAEDFIEIARNLCLNYAVTAAGEITYLGCAEQVSDALGRYHGNWIDAESEAPPAAVEVGTRVVRAGRDRGYWGFAGIDVAVSEAGRIVVFDLNFRLNGSTAALLLAKSVGRVLGRPVLRFRSWKGRGTYQDLLHTACAAMERGILLPLSSCDGAAGGSPGGPPRLSGLVVADTRDEGKEREAELAALGLEG